MFRTLLTVREFAKCANSRVWSLKRCGESIGPEDWTLLSPALRHRFGGRGAGSGTERVRRLRSLAAKTRSYLRPAIQHPNSSGSGSEEEYMSDIVLTKIGHRLVQLC